MQGYAVLYHMHILYYGVYPHSIYVSYSYDIIIPYTLVYNHLYHTCTWMV